MMAMKWPGIIFFGVGVFSLTLPWIPTLRDSMEDRWRQYAEKTSDGLDDLFLPCSLPWVQGVLLIIHGLFPIMLLLITGRIALSLGAAGLLFWGPSFLLRRLRAKRKTAFHGQLTDSLSLLTNGMRSGLSLQAAIRMATEQLPVPSCQEFQLVLKAHELGETLEDSLERLLDRMWSEDLEMVVTSVRILRRMGGNLPAQFETIVDTLRQRQRVEGKIRSLTAQGRYQTLAIGMVGACLVGGLWIVAPDMMAPLTQTLPGRCCLGLCLSLFTLGVVAMNKLSEVQV